MLMSSTLKEVAVVDVWNAWIETARFGADVQRVMTLRILRIASGGPDAANEMQEMVAEKVSAFGEAQMAVFACLMTGKSLEATAAKAYAPYRRCVSANHRRLNSSSS
jgi:hypothetical protein